MIRVGILTASDKGSRGEREDRSGRLIGEAIQTIGGAMVAYKVVPDERDQIAAALREMADDLGLDLIFTTGGTGLSPRDVTPEATLDVVDRMVPGIAEAMRAESMKITPRAMLTRGVAAIRGRTLIVNLPGSPKAVQECLDIILPALPHGIEILKGEAGECARKS
ncbi:molybdenum cofactor biosynthesis protein, putative [Heliomicrobium modesticaldum Ice1]|uniref:Molybdenum cofactor biosynthesis protein, putative n=1 Tax=Heliobacterium modesticaldum (strain ATCC 51547 / Ice1) TaxID=498761 RepID=B0TI13_HELMI|nr:MogA/MoaB family molybdenum cofactor biosynthesis protein [Heliomicrobium modesticaldum]ABZ82686.1 molybdenum cofactor biosynthesis protein, putative [Heliomicrobium modesticaldum Ice1]